MGPKKQKAQAKNPFYFFMLDIQQNRKPRVRSLKEAADLAGPMWHNMSPQERAPYEEKAKVARANQPKYNSVGEPISEVLAREQAQVQGQQSISMEIERMVQALAEDPYNKLANQNFYFIHVNHYVRMTNGVMVPAEVAVSQFSLKQGVTDVYSTFLDIFNGIPIGFTQKAKDVALRSHKIPLPSGTSSGANKLVKPSQDATGVVNTIRHFILGMDVRVNDLHGDVGDAPLPPMYCVELEREEVRDGLTSLVNKSELLNVPNFRVYPIENLFYHLQKVSSRLKDERGLPSLALAALEFEKDVFSYTPNISCAYHEKEDVTLFCSRSKVRRWAYIIADFCCKDLDIELKDVCHCPPNAKKDHFTEAQGSFSTGWDLKPKGEWGKPEPPKLCSPPPGFSGAMPTPDAAHYQSDDDDYLPVVKPKFPKPEAGAAPFRQQSSTPSGRGYVQTSEGQSSTSPFGLGYVQEGRVPAVSNDVFGVPRSSTGQQGFPPSGLNVVVKSSRDTPPLGGGPGTIIAQNSRNGSTQRSYGDDDRYSQRDRSSDRRYRSPDRRRDRRERRHYPRDERERRYSRDRRDSRDRDERRRCRERRRSDDEEEEEFRRWAERLARERKNSHRSDSDKPGETPSGSVSEVQVKQEPIDPNDAPYPAEIDGVRIKTEPTDEDPNNQFKLIKIDIPGQDKPFNLIRLNLPQ